MNGDQGGSESTDGAMDNTSPITEAALLRWAHSLAGIARTGLGFAESQYERERYEEVLAVAADILAHADHRHDPNAVVDEWLRIVGSGVAGYVTPKVAVGAVVGNDAGEILLIQRADSGVWLYPTGWADIGYSASEVARKEVHEETGVDAEVVGLLGIYDGMRRGYSRTPLYSVVFHCRAVGGSLLAHPLECLDVGWFAADALPTPLAGAELWVEEAFAAIGGTVTAPYFDHPRDAVWVDGSDRHL